MFSHLLSLYLSNKTIKPTTQAKPAVYKPYIAPTYEVALSSITIPAECKGTYTHAFNAPSNVIVRGTAGNDIIFADTNSSAYGLGGDDCIIGTNNTALYGGDGNDTLVSRTGGNYLAGGTGFDTAYYYYLTDAINSIEKEYVK
jgi:Ca2+-binding RTX toxin-like protein